MGTTETFLEQQNRERYESEVAATPIPEGLLPVSRREQVEGSHIRVYIGSGAFVIAEQIFAINGGGDNASLEERRAIADLFVRAVNQSAAFAALLSVAKHTARIFSNELFYPEGTEGYRRRQEALAALAQVEELRKQEAA